MNTPTPPPGYKLVKVEDFRDHPPEGLLVFDPYANEWKTTIPWGERISDQSPILSWAWAIPSPTDSITEEAKTIVANDRVADYGDASESFGRIAKLWSAYMGKDITPWDVAHMMILLKVSRAKTSRKRDTLVDIIGYAECASKLEEMK